MGARPIQATFTMIFALKNAADLEYSVPKKFY